MKIVVFLLNGMLIQFYPSKLSMHTNVMKEFLILLEFSSKQKSFVYVDEVDVLYVVLFGMIVAQWCKDNLDN